MNCGDSSFINEIKDYSAEEIRLILSDQKDLYTPDEIAGKNDSGFTAVFRRNERSVSLRI